MGTGLSFWTFFIFLIFVASCLTSPGHRSTLTSRRSLGAALLIEALLAGRFSLSVHFNLWVAAFNPSLRVFFWMVGKGGLISLKGSAPCHCQAFWRLLGLRGSCGCCGAPAAALACSSCALLLEALHHRRLS